MDTKNLRIRYYDSMGYEPVEVNRELALDGIVHTIQVTKGKFKIPNYDGSAREMIRLNRGHVPHDLEVVSRRVRNLLIRQGLITKKFSAVEFFIDPEDDSFFYVTVVSDAVVDEFCREHGIEPVDKSDRDMPWWSLPGNLDAEIWQVEMAKIAAC